MDPIIGASLISGGSNLLGGLLNKGPSLSDQLKLMRRTEEKKYKWIVEGAQRAGFNPLTALRAGGGQMTQGLQTPLSTGAVIGNALNAGIQTGLNTWANRPDPIEQESRVLDNELKKQRLKQIQNEEARFGQVPAVRTTSSQTRVNGRNPATATIQTARSNPVTDPIAYDANGNPIDAETSAYGSFLSGDVFHDMSTGIQRQFNPPPLRQAYSEWRSKIRNAPTQQVRKEIEAAMEKDMKRRADKYYGRVTPINKPPLVSTSVLPRPRQPRNYIPYQPRTSFGNVQ